MKRPQYILKVLNNAIAVKPKNFITRGGSIRNGL